MPVPIPAKLAHGVTSRQPFKLTIERRILLLAFAGALPGVLVSMILIWSGDYTAKVQWTLSVVIFGVSLGCSLALRERIVMPLQTLSNLLAALREDDFSLRARGARSGDALGDVMVEVNALVDTLRDQRLGAVDATTMLRKVMAEIDVAVFSFDQHQQLQLINRAGQRLLGRPAEQLLGHRAEILGLAECLEDGAPRVRRLTFPGGVGRFAIRASSFRQAGLPHRLLVLSDVSQPLRDEERQAWQRLIRVLGHELNNSLTPIKSIAGSLEQLLGREPLPDDWRDDASRGLAVISTRAGALGRFMDAYARLARLPPPALAPIEVRPFVRRIVGLETRVGVTLVGGPSIAVQGDADQLEQLLINLLHNAADAALETGGGVQVGWALLDGAAPRVEVWIDDEGPGLPNTSNLFVPFFTTKPEGSGIGLVLSRQIAEAHGGSLTLEDRGTERGCRASLRLPI